MPLLMQWTYIEILGTEFECIAGDSFTIFGHLWDLMVISDSSWQWCNNGYDSKQRCSSQGYGFCKFCLPKLFHIPMVGECEWTATKHFWQCNFITCKFLIMVNVAFWLQNTSVSPDGKMLAVLGDSAECLIADAQSGKVGHPVKCPRHCLMFPDRLRT